MSDSLQGMLPLVHDIWGNVVTCTACGSWAQHHDTRRIPCAFCTGTPVYQAMQRVPPLTPEAVTDSPKFEAIIFRGYPITAKHKAWFYDQ